MIQVRGRAVVYGEIWYDEGPPRDSQVDIMVHRQIRAPIPDARSAPFLTMQTDLSAPASAILAGFHETCRYQIRRADGKDALQLEFTADAEAKLEEFCVFYDAFARQKSVL